MAKGQSTSNVYRRRRALAATAQHERADRSPLLELGEVLQAERAHLVDAVTILQCLHAALLYTPLRGHTEEPNYANAAALALGLVRQSAAQLDDARIMKIVQAGTRTKLARKTKLVSRT